MYDLSARLEMCIVYPGGSNTTYYTLVYQKLANIPTV